MAVKSWPASITPDAEDWRLQFNSQVFTSDLNGAIQTAKLPGARWTVSRTFSNRQGGEARALQGFLAGLHGMSGRVYVTPSDWAPYGSPSGSPTVSANQNSGSTTISTTGWTASVSGLLLAGDYFEVNGELKKVTADANSDASGNATLEFSPPLRLAATTGMTIRYTEPRCIMMMEQDDGAGWGITSPDIYATTVNFVEALDI